MAAEAEKRGLPAQLPVMAALVESNLTNVNFGDADSLGYFQMRVSFWERPVRRLRRRPREAGRLVPRHRRTRQGATRQPRPIDHRPQPVRRMDRRRRTPRRAIPRPLPTQARRSQRTARQRTQDTRRTRSRRRRTHRARRAHRAGGADRSRSVRSGRDGRQARRRGAGAAAEQERRARRRRRVRHQGGPDRSADRRCADEAQPGAQDRRLVHVLGPFASSRPAARCRTTRSGAAWTSRRSTARSSARAARWRARSPRSSPSSTRRCGRTRSARRS